MRVSRSGQTRTKVDITGRLAKTLINNVINISTSSKLMEVNESALESMKLAVKRERDSWSRGAQTVHHVLHQINPARSTLKGLIYHFIGFDI
jgi:hypothetical protein